MEVVHLPLADYTGDNLTNVTDVVHLLDQMPGRIFFLSALEYVKQELDRELRGSHANLVEVIVVWSDSPGKSRNKSDSNHAKQGFLHSFKNLWPLEIQFNITWIPDDLELVE